MYTSYVISIQHPSVRNLKIQVIEPHSPGFETSEGQATIRLYEQEHVNGRSLIAGLDIMFHDLSEIEEFADTILAAAHAYRDAHAPSCAIHGTPLDDTGRCWTCEREANVRAVASIF